MARHLFSRRCDNFYRRLVGCHARPEFIASSSPEVLDDLRHASMEVGFSTDEREVYQDSASKLQVRLSILDEALNPLPKCGSSQAVNLGHVFMLAGPDEGRQSR